MMRRRSRIPRQPRLRHLDAAATFGRCSKAA